MTRFDSLTLRREALRLRGAELRRIAALIALKWSTFLESPCPAPEPKHPRDLHATPSA
jgi:hypothetical protein